MAKKQHAPASRPQTSTDVGASDGSSGGGNASGLPDADTAMRPGGLPPAGNVAKDRAKLFPGNSGAKKKKYAAGGRENRDAL